MTSETIYKLAPQLIAILLFAAGWRVNREIHAPDDKRQHVIPLPDIINFISLFATVGCAIILPIASESYLWLSRMVLGGAYVLIAFHPLAIAAHYHLWRRKVVRIQTGDGAASHYANHVEVATALLSVLLATVVAAYLG